MVTFFFWLFLIIDLLITLLALFGKGYRESYGASAINLWFPTVLVVSIIGGLLLHFFYQKVLLALGAVALPLLVLLIWYLIDTKVSP